MLFLTFFAAKNSDRSVRIAPSMFNLHVYQVFVIFPIMITIHLLCDFHFLGLRYVKCKYILNVKLRF